MKGKISKKAIKIPKEVIDAKSKYGWYSYPIKKIKNRKLDQKNEKTNL